MKGTSRIIDVFEMKCLMLDIMSSIDDYCRNNGLRYCLAYGTLLGAIRHKGYIPWDDDIDIWMPRPDYMKFMAEFKHPYYKTYCAEFTPDWNHFIAKVCDDRTVIDEGHGDISGVYVDVFPLDGWPNNRVLANIHYQKILARLRVWSSLHYTQFLKIKKKQGIRKNIKIIVSKFIGLFCSKESAIKKLINIKMKYPYTISKYVGSLTCGDWAVPREDAENLIETMFEGKSFLIPKNYDRWLRVIFGDYMKLPPEKDRVSNHGYQAYWKEQ